ncbi:asparagine synthase-related protein [Salegentibacter maritimus]|uniref:asparagine synthase (glutamine-hydrolyzing) n=1 Tax=Salegentibacter maritimus TaxID=2794347 RepID=A0ABS0TER2_9FLAO|nr:asparagine synthase-related protein [Salegentibacter maritimus]MBI6119536.1 hypothetical protein [Salegentibacter maritimus]
MINFKYYNHLGFHNPYYIWEDQNIKLFEDFDKVINNIGEEKYIDFTAIAQVLSNGYILGDRTIIEGVRKSPWMARPKEDFKSWSYYSVPNHFEKEFSREEIVDTFFGLLKEEMENYLHDGKNIGILLTGGMDSRIVACVLKSLIDSNIIDKDVEVTGITWGMPGSRDVVYASEITQMFGWKWEHLTVDTVQLNNNIAITASMGCEFSPLHLHAMEKVPNFKHLDCILAGSFGDSIGRGEYSGVKVNALGKYTEDTKNFFGLLRSDFKNFVKENNIADIQNYHSLFPQDRPYQQTEQDYQLHYMRRMLNSCMSLIDREIPLYQMFTAPRVFGFIWSLNPHLRDDLIYKRILEKYEPKLLKIPWARTGLVYPDKEGEPDGLSKSHHNYGELFRKELLPSLKDQILSNEISQLGIFDMKLLSKLVKLCFKKPIKGSHTYEEKLIWIASLAQFIKTNKVKSNYSVKPFKASLKNYSNGVIEYNAKYYKRKFNL